MPKGEYGKALRKSGYKNVTLNYTDKKDVKQKRNRSRNIIWFNPLSNKNVSTKVAKRYLNLINTFQNLINLTQFFTETT